MKFSDETADQTTVSPKPNSSSLSKNIEKLGGSRRNSLDSLISAKLGLFDRMFAGEAELEEVDDFMNDTNMMSTTIEEQHHQVSAKKQNHKNVRKNVVSSRPASPRKPLKEPISGSQQPSTMIKKQKSIIKKR